MHISEFDGAYEIVLGSDIHEVAPGYHDFGNARISVLNGQISGADSGGVSWTGSLSLVPDVDDTTVEAALTVDPTTGQPDAVVMHYDGILRREPVTHRIRLRLTNVHGVFYLRGSIKIGPVTIVTTVKRLEGDQ